ncbi:MBL fold metallo-hydrolase [Rhodovulum sp. DZ06]|uniref:MBL fold metallo-hydrolase n=1 Tax=Rhodovulum sp. DZ06 TaxID=3425126 RepID=UPI003D34B09B
MTTEARAPLHFPHETPPENGTAIRVAEGVFWARLPLPMRLDHVNIYLMDDRLHGGPGWTVIDTGFRGRTTRAALEAIEAQVLDGAPIWRVIVTHHHPDHVGSAGWLLERHGAELWTTRTAYMLTRMLQLDHHETQPQANIDFYVQAGAPAERLEAYRNAEPFNFSRTTDPLPIGYRRIREGGTVQMAGRRWQVLTGEGHAAEHATFWSEDDELVVTGDQVIPGISSNLGVHPNEPLADPVGDWLESCARFRDHARADQYALPGHKLPFVGIPDRLRQLIDNHRNALDRLRAHLKEPRRVAECFTPVFGRELDAAVFGMGLIEAQAHMNYLHLRGETAREKDAGGAWLYRMA